MKPGKREPRRGAALDRNSDGNRADRLVLVHGGLLLPDIPVAAPAGRDRAARQRRAARLDQLVARSQRQPPRGSDPLADWRERFNPKEAA